MKRRLWPVLLFSGLGLAILLGLGFWQLQRLTWKNALIANFDNTKVTLSGHFVDRGPFRFLSTNEGGAAWLVLQGFETQDGKTILVSRGKIPHDAAIPMSPTDNATITGHLQTHDQGRGYFDVDNNPTDNIWYWWDVSAMLGQPAKNGEVLHLISGSPGTEGLVVDTPKSNLKNNHLGYAITWFGLAAVLVVMTALFLYQNRQKS